MGRRHPLVTAGIRDFEQKRFEEDYEAAREDGLDVGDYSFIDNQLFHCPIADWVSMGQVVPKIKNQRKCGACWAFSTVAAVENLWARYFNVDTPEKIPELSEQ